ncbi:hypothetical protein LCGC14_1829960 [marine sediment metagenome]|uniref:DNA cytosine methyltransferase n=1 Tax=marine sediment metagenome TaxID=412755 RepID=A0A0F9IVZ6_9ZZZZ
MRVLICCEFSGIVRDAFKAKGHDAWSCDLLPTEREGQHIQGDVLDILNDGWDMILAFPPCTYLCVSGIRWIGHPKHPNRRELQRQAIDFFMAFINSKAPKVVVENPISIMSTKYRKPDQIIRPCMFGDDSNKATCLWLRKLPKLKPTNIIEPGRHISASGRSWDKWFFDTSLISNLAERSKARSRTFQGVADCMAATWG